MKKYKSIGLMSGTSLDGLDIVYCELWKTDVGWGFDISEGKTVAYPPQLRERLAISRQLSALELSLLDIDLGRWFGETVAIFMASLRIQPDFIASHGHTVFHQPEKGLTLQAGNAYEIMKACRVPVISDFRSLDVCLGGQGAPLVPMGDLLLFGGYDFCLNLGGMANISVLTGPQVRAFDICPANTLLNLLSQQIGMDYDRGGQVARRGQAVPELLEKLNALKYYQKRAPKSLGYEWVEQNVLPLLHSGNHPTEDLLHTVVLHISTQIATAISTYTNPSLGYRALVTGGGAHNDFLMACLESSCAKGISIEKPASKVVDYKEALVFALLGLLRAKNEHNCLASVTGASRDNCGGTIHGQLQI